MPQRDVFVVNAVRTAIGSFGGSLKEVALTALATEVVHSVLAHSGVGAEQVDSVAAIFERV